MEEIVGMKMFQCDDEDDDDDVLFCCNLRQT